MGKINILGFDVANLIAAGEVVDRPASVIKELCENSIDAGAKNITVEIRHGGTSYMRVSDDGCGIDAEDLPLTVLRHATSKIATAEDLSSIGTLGFRGEALAAIASVCKLKVVSRTHDQSFGTVMDCEAGEIIDINEMGCAKGTTVIARELFYNVPARRKFLKKDASEAAAVAAVMEKIAISCPHICVKYVQDGQVRFMTAGNGSLIDAIRAVFGRETAMRMSPVDRTDPNGIRITGYIGEPDLVRSNKNSENFFINSRFVKSRTAMAAIEQAYSTRIPHGKFPVCILNILLNPAVVDVNVHPSKLEVKFANERIIFEAVYYAVLNTLESSLSRPEMRISKEADPFANEKKTVKIPEKYTPVAKSGLYKKPAAVTAANAFVPVERDPESRPEKMQIRIPAPSPASEPAPAPVKAPDEVSTPAPAPQKPQTPAPALEKKAAPQPKIGIMAETKSETKEIIKKEEPPEFTIIGEAYNCYVMVQLEDRLLIVDKHAAHERILFDELCRKMRSAERSSQILMYPVRVPVREEEAEALSEYKEQICAMGFAYTYDKAAGALIISEVPSELGRDRGADMMSELASVLYDSTGSVDATSTKYFEAKLYQASCKAAVKGGRVYAPEHISWIISRLLQKPDENGCVIKTCPHGRPVAFEIKKNSIERQFERLV